MSNIKKSIQTITKNATEDTLLSVLGFSGYVKVIDLYNYGETMAYLHLPGDDNENPGAMIPVGTFLTVSADNDEGIDITTTSVSFEGGSGALNITVQFTKVI